MTLTHAPVPASAAAHGRRAVVLFAHGSRDQLWQEPMQAVARRIRADQPELPVVCAFLELTAPDLPAACDALWAQGVRHITVLPLFLGVGRHARDDLPLLLQEIRARHPALTLELRPAVGEDPRVVELLARIASESS